MNVVTAPPSLRAQITDVVVARLNRAPSPIIRLDSLPMIDQVLLLLELEQTFNVLLDPDEVETFADLIALTETRVRENAAPPLSTPAQLIDIAAARRARRARGGGGPGEPSPTAHAPAGALPANPPVTDETAWRHRHLFVGLCFAAALFAAFATIPLGAPQPGARAASYAPWSLIR